MGEHEAGEGFRVRLQVVTEALRRLDPRYHRTMIEDLEQLRERYQAELDRSGPEGVEIFCECGSGDCVAKLTLSLTDYGGVRAHPERFIVAPDHDTPTVENVIEKRAGYWIVEKHEEEATLARELDPRS